ncbi:MAG: hypothetical protein K6T92_07540 [Candidatus Rokubacteria bacterium]|nr:hypothetical protein [Candidatus Rokubacteria bacterium]
MKIRTDRNLRLLFASLLLWMLGVGLYEGLIPIFARQLGASAVQLGSLYTVRSLGLAVGFLAGAFSVMGTMTSIGFLLSPATGGVIAEYAGIRAVRRV